MSIQLIAKSDDWARGLHRLPNGAVYAIRLANLGLLLRLFGTRRSMKAAVNCSDTQISQMFAVGSSHFRPIGSMLARRIERELCLPAHVLDLDGGVKPHLAQIAAAHRIDRRDPVDLLVAGSDATEAAAALTPLQQATLDAVRRAMADGRFTDRDCVDILSRWVAESPQRAKSTSPEPATLRPAALPQSQSPRTDLLGA